MGHFLHDITSIFIITLIIFGLYISTVLLVNLLHVVVYQAGDSHFAATFVAESSRDFKSILFTPNSLVDFDFLQGVARFSAAFYAEIPLVFHGGTLPSDFTFFLLLYSLLCFSSIINPLTVCLSQKPPAGSSFFNSPGHKNRHPLFSECRFCYPIVRFDFWRKWRKFGVNPLSRAPKIKCSCGFQAVISTCRPYRPCRRRQLREQPGVRAGQRPGSRWSAPSRRRMLHSPERSG